MTIKANKLTTREHINRRNDDLKKDFISLSNKRTPGGKGLFRHEAVVEKLACKYYLAEGYVDRLLKKL